MDGRGTVVLAAVAIALGLYVWLEKPPRNGRAPSGEIVESAASRRQPTAPGRPLLTFTPADVTSIRLERSGRTVEAQRRDDGWRETEPPGVIDDFLRNLTQLAVLSEIPAGAGELKEYGLEPAPSLLQLYLRDERSLVLHIGDRNPATTGVYVRVGDGPVVLAGALVEWEFEKAFKALSKPAGS